MCFTLFHIYLTNYQSSFALKALSSLSWFPLSTMSRRANGQIGSQYNKTQSTSNFCYYKQNYSPRKAGNKSFIEKFGFLCPQRPGLSPLRLLKHFTEKFTRVVCMISKKRRPTSENSISERSKRLAHVDSRREEAIEDCIRFINSSCTLSRSNSTTNHS